MTRVGGEKGAHFACCKRALPNVFCSIRSRIFIQTVLFFALLGLIEIAARFYETLHPQPTTELQLALQPYLTFAGMGPTRGALWRDIVHGRDIPSTMNFNNYGFPATFDYQIAPDADYLARYGKQSGERLVLITGASVVQSAGATKDETTISARLEYHLNAKSSGARYRVLNMAIGSWNAYQQFIALSLFGRPFDPDWIVVMDGHNDGATPCIHGAGAINPREWPKLLYLTYGGTGEKSLVADLARYSALVRLMYKQPQSGDPRKLIVDTTDPSEPRQIRVAGIRFGVLDRQLAFYLESQRNVLALFHRTNILFSTQPLLTDNIVAPSYRASFASNTNFATVEAELDRFMIAHANDSCDRHDQIYNPHSLGYFMGRSALRLKELAAATQNADSTRRIIYRNVEAALPYEQKLREQFFIDRAHLTEQGLDRVAEFFAANILAADR